MKQYSPFFSTLHDEDGPVGHLGGGTHYSVLRAVLWEPEPAFHDFAVVWDEDHDLRVVWVLEQMLTHGLLGRALVVGERKGGVTVLTREGVDPKYGEAVEQIAGSVPTDCFSSNVEQLDHATGLLINDEPPRVRAYVAGIDALWRLGKNPCTFTTRPFHAE